MRELNSFGAAGVNGKSPLVIGKVCEDQGSGIEMSDGVVRGHGNGVWFDDALVVRFS
jgi:hypothetical protein